MAFSPNNTTYISLSFITDKSITKMNILYVLTKLGWGDIKRIDAENAFNSDIKYIVHYSNWIDESLNIITYLIEHENNVIRVFYNRENFWNIKIWEKSSWSKIILPQSTPRIEFSREK